MIKIGQIGIGHNHAAGKMETVRALPELFEVIGYAEENEEWVEKRGNRDCYKDLPRLTVEELIEKCDAILVECDVWNSTKVAQMCIDAGKHIHMDKPASGTLAEFKHLLDTAKENELIVQLGYLHRYTPATQEILQRIKDGKMGQIMSINAEMSTCHPDSYRQWLQNFDGGIMYILGSHLIDLIVYILGKPQKIHSYLKCSCLNDICVPDNTFALLEYERALARVFVSSVEVNGFGRRQFVVSGSEATASICPLGNPLTLTWSDKTIADKIYADRKETIEVKEPWLYESMMREFYSYIVGEKENPFPYEHEYAAQEVLMQIVQENQCAEQNKA